MASDTDRQVNSSPAKRLKLDHTSLLADSSVEISIGNVKGIVESSHEGFGAGIAPNEACESGANFRLRPKPCLPQPRPADGAQPSTSASDISNQVMSVCEDQQDEDEDDDQDEVSSTVSNLSLSGLSDMSGQGWKPVGPMDWVHRQMMTGVKPRKLLNDLGADEIPSDMDDYTLWKIIVDMLSVPPMRSKLKHVNTIFDVVNLVKNCKRVVVLTGAGVSVSCGIPDFRSRDGIYSRLADDFPDLPDPQAMFDIKYFSQDPRPFFKFAKEIYPGQFKPSTCHQFIRKLEDHGKLLRNYTQNIDTLENVAGIKNVIECHGSFAFASCTRCKAKVTADEIRDDIMAQRIPRCKLCAAKDETEGSPQEAHYSQLFYQGIMKPDIVFFGEGLPEAFHEAMADDKDHCDLFIVIGSSLKVRPVALIPNSIPANVPQVLINREPLSHLRFDVELLGDADVIINQLSHLLGEGWSDLATSPLLSEAGELLPDNCETICDGPADQVPKEEAATLEDSVKKLVDSDIAASLTAEIDVSHVLNECDAPVTEELSNEEVLSALDNHVTSFEKSQSDYQGEIKLRHLSTESTMHVDMDNVDAGNSERGVEEISKLTHLKEADAEFASRLGTVADDSRTVLAASVSAKERHMSLDSTRDSGIGDSCNSVDSSVDKEREVTVVSTSNATSSSWPNPSDCLAKRLPANCYHFVPPNRYIFPGAEVYVKHSAAYSDSGDDAHSVDESSSHSGDSDMEGNTEDCNDHLLEAGFMLNVPIHETNCTSSQES